MRKTYNDQIRDFSFDIAEERLMEKTNPDYERVLDLRDVAGKISRVYDVPYQVVVDEIEDGIKKFTKVIKNREHLKK
jgi:hypothetical protein